MGDGRYGPYLQTEEPSQEKGKWNVGIYILLDLKISNTIKLIQSFLLSSVIILFLLLKCVCVCVSSAGRTADEEDRR